MVQFEEALSLVMSSAYTLDIERIHIGDSLQRILAEDVFSDMDMPPFNKSAVDGYACRREDLSMEMEVIEVVPAGKIPEKMTGKGECTRIMTGAMVPERADMVMMVEDTELTPGGKVVFTGVQPAYNICYHAEDIKKGDLVLKSGTIIRPQEIAVMASTGYVRPVVYRKVNTGVISTGDELVEPDQNPEISQIRNSNAQQLIAQLGRMGLKGYYYGIAKDRKERIRELIVRAMEDNDMVLLTGGVSMGEYDYVPEVLDELRVNIRFSTIAIQPGRPTVFGVTGNGFLFGLPGNPVSSFVLFELLVKPLIYKLMGHDFLPIVWRLPMGISYSRKKSGRKSVIPVIIRNGSVFPVEYHGSAHIHSYINASGLMIFDTGLTDIKEGEMVDVRQV
jgi:molybdopterin molybdotransferase